MKFSNKTVNTKHVLINRFEFMEFKNLEGESAELCLEELEGSDDIGMCGLCYLNPVFGRCAKCGDGWCRICDLKTKKKDCALERATCACSFSDTIRYYHKNCKLCQTQTLRDLFESREHYISLLPGPLVDNIAKRIN